NSSSNMNNNSSSNMNNNSSSNMNNNSSSNMNNNSSSNMNNNSNNIKNDYNNSIDEYKKLNLDILMDVAQFLRRRIAEKGALALSANEIYIDRDKKIRIKDSIPTHYLVEEFMLLANITVAEYILKHVPDYALLRKHPLPSAIDVPGIDSTSSHTINKSLELLDDERKAVVKRMITRSLQQAIYFVSGDSADYFHYGLATPVYTHFTSPIRRYPDIIVHRTLSYIIEGDYESIDGLSEVATTKTTSQMNFSNRNARNIGWMISEMFLYLNIVEKDLDGVVVRKERNGYHVFIQEYGLEEYVESDGEYKLFDKIKVKIIKNFEEYCITRKMVLVEV
ncbi:exosome complex exonuclease DIS3/RRP44, partial [Enteropsectra breve]